MISLWRTLLTSTIIILATQPVTTSAANPEPSFTSAEHITMGNKIKLYFSPHDPGTASSPLHLPNGLQITYGDIISFGDFYEVPGQPISQGTSDSERKARFMAAFNSFAVDTSIPDEANQILNIIHDEQTKIDDGMKNGEKAEDIYKKIATDFNRQFNCATGGGCATDTWWLYPGKYLILANEDYDHFGMNTWLTYQTGHELALQLAADAHQTNDLKKLEVAYAMNAFASHFLSDRFSSGHMRTPRTELPAHTSPSLTGTLLSQYMHDEENVYGLHVHNLQGDHWTAYGDRYYFDAKNDEHIHRMLATLQLSADQIFAAYQSGKSQVEDELYDLIPQTDEVANSGRQDISPLFYWDENAKKLMRRQDMSNPYDRNWTSDWWGWSTLLELKRERGLSDEAKSALALSDFREHAIENGLI